MKHLTILLTAVLLASCCGQQRQQASEALSIANGEFISNLPGKVVGIHQELPGKSILFLWLHGGVYDIAKHDIYCSKNHWDCCDADDSVLCYLQKKNIKAIALFPVCYKANLDHPIHWRDCFDDVKKMMDCYIDKGMIDTDRMYIAGSSDGGTGTWDYVESHPDLFAAAIAQSCGRPRKCSIPVYFFNTRSEHDCTAEVDSLVNLGFTNIQYKYCGEVDHGGDAAECTEAFLDEYFSHIRK